MSYMSSQPELTAPRPWYREPWPWVLIAIPALTVVASGITLWLAISRPDHIVVEPAEYDRIKSELNAQPSEPESDHPHDDG